MKCLLEKFGFYSEIDINGEEEKVYFLPMLSEFIKKNDSDPPWYNGNYDRIVAYCNYITRPFEKYMFMPCDKDGNILINPSETGALGALVALTKEEVQQAKEYKHAMLKVIFDMDIYSYIEKYSCLEEAINKGIKLTIL